LRIDSYLVDFTIGLQFVLNFQRYVHHFHITADSTLIEMCLQCTAIPKRTQTNDIVLLI